MHNKKIISLIDYLELPENTETDNFILVFDSSTQGAEELLRSELARGRMGKFSLFIATGDNAQLFEDIMDYYQEDKYSESQDESWLLPTAAVQDIHEIVPLINGSSSDTVVLYSTNEVLRKEIELLT